MAGITTSPQLRESPETANTHSRAFNFTAGAGAFATDCARQEMGDAPADAIKSAAESHDLRRFTGPPTIAPLLNTQSPSGGAGHCAATVERWQYHPLRLRVTWHCPAHKEVCRGVHLLQRRDKAPVLCGAGGVVRAQG